jgi:hypothetical protein
MRRAEIQPTQSGTSALGKHYRLSERERRLFVNSVAESPVPDIDKANDILTRVPKIYGFLGVNSNNRRDAYRGFEDRLYGGTAEQQAEASHDLQSIENAHGALTEIFPGNKRVR